MYAWEACLMEGVWQTRRREMVDVKSLAYYRAWMVFGMSVTPTLVATVTFITYGSLVDEVSASDIFTALSLFNMLRVPLALLPFVISMLTQNQVSMTRIRRYLLLEEGLPEHTPDLHMDGVAVQVIDGSFAWGARQTSDQANDGSSANQRDASKKQKKQLKQKLKRQEREHNARTGHHADELELEVNPTGDVASVGDTSTSFHLDGINLRVPTGRTYAIIGSVGCGKSTLIQSLLGLTRLVNGQMLLSGDLAYVPQEAWIRNASVRENILFGSAYDEQRYRTVIDACALTRDLDIFPAGDRTEIGERGINLSGRCGTCVVVFCEYVCVCVCCVSTCVCVFGCEYMCVCVCVCVLGVDRRVCVCVFVWGLLLCSLNRLT
jgi:ATP-binding cassette, subfamily C (CFTR/MRP), member 1